MVLVLSSVRSGSQLSFFGANASIWPDLYSSCVANLGEQNFSEKNKKMITTVLYQVNTNWITYSCQCPPECLTRSPWKRWLPVSSWIRNLAAIMILLSSSCLSFDTRCTSATSTSSGMGWATKWQKQPWAGRWGGDLRLDRPWDLVHQGGHQGGQQGGQLDWYRDCDQQGGRLLARSWSID